MSKEYEDFPPPFDLSDPAAIAEYYGQLEALQRRARADPLDSGLCFSFNFTIPTNNPLPHARKLPHIPQLPISLRLDQPLQFPEHYSQLWTAVGELDGAQVTFMLKTIQPSMCSYPEVDDYGGWQHDYEFLENLANGEAFAYDRLEQKQGLCIPYFFGLHNIITPSNEVAWVLVFEYIPGESWLEYADSRRRTITDTCDVLKLTIDTLTELMADGWCLGDPLPHNIIITGSPGARSVDFIDLHPVFRFFGNQLDKQRLYYKRSLYLDLCELLGDYTEEVQHWAVQNMDFAVCRPLIQVLK
ncbi:hypothetical protein B0H19DRAFT_1070677 [Mycena capillaripes]|nr:hypothetical protein B0H19DRAFT_1070677 [Mycena capillaripes]